MVIDRYSFFAWGQFNEPLLGKHLSLPFLKVTPLSPFQTHKELFEPTRCPSKALNTSPVMILELQGNYQDTVKNSVCQKGMSFCCSKDWEGRACCAPLTWPPCPPPLVGSKFSNVMRLGAFDTLSVSVVVVLNRISNTQYHIRSN